MNIRTKSGPQKCMKCLRDKEMAIREHLASGRPCCNGCPLAVDIQAALSNPLTAAAKKRAGRTTMEQREREAVNKHSKGLRNMATNQTENVYNNQRLLRDLPFSRFPHIQEELMTITGRNDFYSHYYVGYRNHLKKTLDNIRAISLWLANDKVRQSEEYGYYSAEANRFFIRAENAQCSDVVAIIREGEALKTKGWRLKNKTEYNLNKSEHEKKVKKLALVATLYTIIAAIPWIYFITGHNEITQHLQELPFIIEFIAALLIFFILMSMLLGFVFLWSELYDEMSDDRYKRKEFGNTT